MSTKLNCVNQIKLRQLSVSIQSDFDILCYSYQTVVNTIQNKTKQSKLSSVHTKATKSLSFSLLDTSRIRSYYSAPHKSLFFVKSLRYTRVMSDFIRGSIRQMSKWKVGKTALQQFTKGKVTAQNRVWHGLRLFCTWLFALYRCFPTSHLSLRLTKFTYREMDDHDQIRCIMTDSTGIQ